MANTYKDPTSGAIYAVQKTGEVLFGLNEEGRPVPLSLGAGGGIVSGEALPFGADYVLLDPPAKPTTITYKRGGSGGAVVATVTLTYSGDDVASQTVVLS